MDAMRLLDLNSEEFHCGGLVGLAEIDKCFLLDSQSNWLAHRGDHLSPGYFNGPCYAWHFDEALSLPEIIDCPGELGLFYLSDGIRERVYRTITNDHYREFAEHAPYLIT